MTVIYQQLNILMPNRLISTRNWTYETFMNLVKNAVWHDNGKVKQLNDLSCKWNWRIGNFFCVRFVDCCTTSASTLARCLFATSESFCLLLHYFNCRKYVVATYLHLCQRVQMPSYSVLGNRLLKSLAECFHVLTVLEFWNLGGYV